MDFPTKIYSQRRATLTAEVARQRYTYDRTTGQLHLKGKPWFLSPEGFIKHNGRKYLVKIVAYMMAHNAPYPEYGVGLRDRNKSNLKPENLYAFTKEQQPSRQGHIDYIGMLEYRRQA